MIEIVELVVADDAESWAAAGFTVDPDGPNDAAVRVGHVRIRLVGAPSDGAGRGVRSWSVRGVAAVDTIDGLATTALDTSLAEPAAHANGAVLIDHVVIATPDVDRTVAAFVALGCEPRRERLGGSESAPIRQVFVRAGEVILEIVGPPVVPSDETLAARPATFWGLAYTSGDLDATAAWFGPAMGTPRDAVQPGRRIATMRHAELGSSVATVFMSA